MRSVDAATSVESFAGLDAVPHDAQGLFAQAGNFFATRAWWHAVLAHAVPAGAQPRLVLIRQHGVASGLFPMLVDRGFRALTTPYTCCYEPSIAPGHAAVFEIFAQYCRSFAVTRLDALDHLVAAVFASAARQAGLVAAPFNHFGNWYEDVSGLDWTAWLARRPGALRETIRRRLRRATGACFTVFDAPADLARGIVAFETVYAKSWKRPEPWPEFNPAQIRAAGSLGLARVGVLWIDAAPAAAQFWIVDRGRASLLKLAHDEAFRSSSPGTLLTAWMIRHLIEQERVAELDFGRGDDAYKRDWVSCRRQRLGLLLINPRRPGGLAALAQQRVGRIAARLRHR